MSSKLGDLPMYLDVDVVFLTDTNMRIRGQTSPSWVIIMVHFFHFIYLFTTFILKQSFSLKWKGHWRGREVLRCSIQFYWMQWNICSSRGHYCLMLQSICLYISASLFFPPPPPAQSMSSPPPAPPPASPSSREEVAVFQLQTYLTEPRRPESRRLRSYSSPPDPGHRYDLPTSSLTCCQPPQAPPTPASPPISTQVSRLVCVLMC